MYGKLKLLKKKDVINKKLLEKNTVQLKKVEKQIEKALKPRIKKYIYIKISRFIKLQYLL